MIRAKARKCWCAREDLNLESACLTPMTKMAKSSKQSLKSRSVSHFCCQLIVAHTGQKYPPFMSGDGPQLAQIENLSQAEL